MLATALLSLPPQDYAWPPCCCQWWEADNYKGMMCILCFIKIMTLKVISAG